MSNPRYWCARCGRVGDHQVEQCPWPTALRWVAIAALSIGFGEVVYWMGRL